MRRGASSSQTLRRSEFSPSYLLSLADREVRDHDGVFYVEGLRFAYSALQSGAKILAVARSKRLGGGELWERLSEYPQIELRQDQLEALRFSPEPQGLILVLAQQTIGLQEVKTLKSGMWVGIESLQSPGNFGTILRSMVAADSAGLMLFGNRGQYEDAYDPTVIRASMGAHLMLPVVRTSYAELSRWSRRSEVRVLGADATAQLDYRAIKYRRPTLLMIGSERTGLSPGQRSICDDLVRIPMARGIDSLNVAMAATVILFEAFGQRRAVRS